MKYRILMVFLLTSTLIGCKQEVKQEGGESTSVKIEHNYSPAQALVAKMVDKVGSMDKLKALKDVEYTYTYHDTEKDLKDISLERYMFDGEKSWAKYAHHEKFVFPDKEGDVVQGYDGKQAWLNIGGKYIPDPEAVKMSDFFRKTNFYWFAMMPKLMDPGIKYSMLKDRQVGEINYKIVKVTYEANVGDVQDEYLLYINPTTSLVDQFLFTVKDFNITEPLLMKVGYSKINDVWLSTKRSYTQSNWQGEVLGEHWVREISENVKFNNGFTDDLFAMPAL